MRDNVMKAVLGGFLVLALIATAVYIGSKRMNQPAVMPPDQVAPVPMPPVPDKLMAPAPPSQPEQVFSASYIRGYQDGYSGAWLAPARWVVVGEYRAGHHAGRLDRASGKPNRFNK